MTSLREHRIGPYTVLWRVGVTRAGTVYRAIDIYHAPVVLAVLDRATDGAYRRRFGDAVRRGWTGDGTGSPVLNADLSGPVPWAATRDDGRPGAERMLAGVTGEQPPHVSTAPPRQPATRGARGGRLLSEERPTRSAAAGSARGRAAPPGGVGHPPYSPDVERPSRGGADDRGVPPAPVRARATVRGAPPAAARAQTAVRGAPRVLWPPAAGDEAAEAARIDVLGPAASGHPPVPTAAVLAGHEHPRHSRGRRDTRLLVALLACLGVLLVVAVPLVAARLVDSGLTGQIARSPAAGRPVPTAPAATSSRTPDHTGTASPTSGGTTVEPGLEPPRPGSWPDSWPRYTNRDRTYLVDGLRGVDVDFRVPDSWSCLQAARTTDAGPVRHTCVDERHRGGGRTPGIRLTVRDCPDPCDAGTHRELRRDVPGWGRRWLGPDDTSVYIEFRGTLDGEAVYGLVISRVFPGDGAGTPDRHLLLQSIVALDDVPTIQKLANDIRAATG